MRTTLLVGVVSVLAVVVAEAAPSPADTTSEFAADLERSRETSHAEAAKAEKLAQDAETSLNGAISASEERQDQHPATVADIALQKAQLDEGSVEGLIKQRITRREDKLKADLASLKEAENDLAGEQSKYSTAITQSEDTLHKAESHAVDEFEPKKATPSPELAEPSAVGVKKPLSVAEAAKQVKEAQARYVALQAQKKEEHEKWVKEHTKTGGWGDQPVTLEGQAPQAQPAAQASSDPAAVALSAAPAAAATATVTPQVNDSRTKAVPAAVVAAPVAFSASQPAAPGNDSGKNSPVVPTATVSVMPDTPSATPKKLLRN